MKAASAERYCSRCGERNQVGNRVGYSLLCRRCLELIPEKTKWYYRMKAKSLDFRPANP